MKFTQEQSPSTRQTFAAEDAPRERESEVKPSPLIKASDVKAKRAVQSHDNSDKNSVKKIRGRKPRPDTESVLAEEAVAPVAEIEPAQETVAPVTESEPVQEFVTPIEESEPVQETVTPVAESEPAEETPVISEEARREIIEDAMARPEIYEIDESLFKGTDELAEQIDDAETYTYETENEEKKPLEKKKFKSRRTSKARRRTVTAIIAAAAVPVLFIGGASVYASSYNKIYPNITIMGEDVGGMTREEAQDELRAKYKDEGIPNITVTCEDAFIELDPTVLGASFKIDETVENAYNIGRQDGIFKKIKNVIFKGLPDEDLRLDMNICSVLCSTGSCRPMKTIRRTATR